MKSVLKENKIVDHHRCAAPADAAASPALTAVASGHQEDDSVKVMQSSDKKIGKESHRSPAQKHNVRLLIPCYAAGAIIGPHGKKVKALNEKHKATVTLLQNDDGYERVVVCKATTINDVALLVGDIAEILRKRLSFEQYSVRLLFQHSQAVFIKGPNGHSYTLLYQKNGAKIKLFPDKAPHSADRVCQITARKDAIVSCVSYFLQQLIECPSKENSVMYYVPCRDDSYNYGGFNIFDRKCVDLISESKVQSENYMSQHSTSLHRPTLGNRGGSKFSVQKPMQVTSGNLPQLLGLKTPSQNVGQKGIHQSFHQTNFSASLMIKQRHQRRGILVYNQPGAADPPSGHLFDFSSPTLGLSAALKPLPPNKSFTFNALTACGRATTCSQYSNHHYRLNGNVNGKIFKNGRTLNLSANSGHCVVRNHPYQRHPTTNNGSHKTLPAHGASHGVYSKNKPKYNICTFKCTVPDSRTRYFCEKGVLDQLMLWSEAEITVSAEVNHCDNTRIIEIRGGAWQINDALWLLKYTKELKPNETCLRCHKKKCLNGAASEPF